MKGFSIWGKAFADWGLPFAPERADEDKDSYDKNGFFMRDGLFIFWEPHDENVWRALLRFIIFINAPVNDK